MTTTPITRLEDYAEYIGDDAVQRIRAKAEELRGQRVVHMNSTFYAGGVVEIILSLVGLQNQFGIDTEWRLLRGSEAFFDVTREMHDAMQGGPLDLTDEKKRIYEENLAENALFNRFDHDAVYMHDHHTMGMVDHVRKRGAWIWRGHLDMSSPNPDLIDYLAGFSGRYDAAVVILESYMQKQFDVPQFSFMPAIDPLKPHNQTFPQDMVRAKLAQYDIPVDRPIITQVSRYDRFKDPHGVVDAFEIASKDIDATLVMLGNRPADDPDKNVVFDTLVERRSERVLVFDVNDYDLVGVLQQEATAVVQKSIREGFGLTVSEALWKGTPVIGGNAGGIPHQIDDGLNGYVVESPEQAAERMVELVGDPDKAAKMGERGREKVRQNFLITRLLEQHLDLLGGFEAHFVSTA